MEVFPDTFLFTNTLLFRIPLATKYINLTKVDLNIVSLVTSLTRNPEVGS